MTLPHRFECRVYYEDTDLAGIVYYANYLKFIERARTEFVRTLGVDQGALRQTRGIVFAVRRVVADYLSPARFDDVLTVETEVRRVSGARVELQQNIRRGDDALVKTVVTLVALGADGRPRRLPPELRHAFAG